MKKASISELKNQLSAYLQRVRAGQTVIVYDRDRPIARIDRVADEDDDERIAQLQRAGIITPPSEPLPLDVLRTPLPRAGHSVLDALLDALERDHAADFATRFIAESPAKLRRIRDYFAALLGLGAFPAVRCNAPEFSAVVGADGRVAPCFFIASPALAPRAPSGADAPSRA